MPRAFVALAQTTQGTPNGGVAQPLVGALMDQTAQHGHGPDQRPETIATWITIPNLFDHPACQFQLFCRPAGMSTPSQPFTNGSITVSSKALGPTLDRSPTNTQLPGDLLDTLSARQPQQCLGALDLPGIITLAHNRFQASARHSGQLDESHRPVLLVRQGYTWPAQLRQKF